MEWDVGSLAQLRLTLQHADLGIVVRHQPAGLALWIVHLERDSHEAFGLPVFALVRCRQIYVGDRFFHKAGARVSLLQRVRRLQSVLQDLDLRSVLRTCRL